MTTQPSIESPVSRDPPSTLDLTINAATMLTITSDDADRLSLLILRRLWACQQRHAQALTGAFDAGVLSAGGTVGPDEAETTP